MRSNTNQDINIEDLQKRLDTLLKRETVTQNTDIRPHQNNPFHNFYENEDNDFNSEYELFILIYYNCKFSYFFILTSLMQH